MAIRVDFFGLDFDFKYRNRLESLIPTLGIESPRLSGRVGTNRQDSGRFPDPNSVTRTDAVSLKLPQSKTVANAAMSGAN